MCGSDKSSSLSRYGNNYDRKKFSSKDPRRVRESKSKSKKVQGSLPNPGKLEKTCLTVARIQVVLKLDLVSLL